MIIKRILSAYAAFETGKRDIALLERRQTSLGIPDIVARTAQQPTDDLSQGLAQQSFYFWWHPTEAV